MLFERPVARTRKERIRRAHTIADLRGIARRSVPRFVFDFADGSADEEVTIARARQAFVDVQFNPRVLRDVSMVDTTVTVLGETFARPFAIAPTGFTRVLHADGELAGARAAGRAGIPFCLSTMGTASPEAVRAANRQGSNWFQLYVWSERERSTALLHRAWTAGFTVLVVTVDVPVSGRRLRDIRNGFRRPPKGERAALFSVGLRTIADAAPHIRWWVDLLTSPPITFASMTEEAEDASLLLAKAFDPSVTFGDLTWIRAAWPGKIMLKGVQSLDDARLAAAHGVDAIVLSAHGGRQLDKAPVPFHLLPVVAREVGADLEVCIDTGILRGDDIVASLALGARLALVGRAYTYGLMAGGECGVTRAIEILGDEIERCMRLLGVTHLAELEPAHVAQLERLVPRAARLYE
ncbi:alpha-hydroxy acid oxidase [Phytohabitans sp. ZYX-F-186]|uniref:Alpha-hydroxy acid oxidase n=1 Tax=Phytohabitans maris TaxID=3071409 RepID=A0ABU0ZC88_9ACTN|nr:alpha-hydroxy acid oxidase [Phytohabitans sp. ZYX-F-186]MDQ7904648.1 alpha-hydroxy acid oxidase [Phytohabitans sp. ZYX-F-186]